MEPLRLVHVAILYVHPLLGEGLAKLLAREPGVAAVAIPRDDAAETATVLESGPDIVVVERGQQALPEGLLDAVAAPLLLFVAIDGPPCPDVYEAATEDPDVILSAIRRLQHRDRAPVLSA